ncbi:MAG: TolC family protein [Balneolaceae bacterium]|nr:TolC family protein [Balneolaceae bacterium]
MMVALITLIISGLLQGTPPDSLSLQQGYELASKNYPVAANIELQRKITDLNVKVANAGYYPNLEIGGKASYQSEVTDFALPGGGGPPAVSKDQYEASLSVVQNIYDGGAVDIRKELERARGQQEVHTSQLELHQVRKQVDQVYFGILLSQQQSRVNDLLIDNLRERLATVRSRVKNGVLLPSQQNILQAELIKAQQDSSELESTIRAGYDVLSEITGVEIPRTTTLSLPEVDIDMQHLQPQRPEYDLFESRRNAIESQIALAKTRKLPAISAFGTTAYGRPGFNFLEDDFHGYYILGLRLKWNIKDLWSANREMQALEIQQQKITHSEQAFTTQMKASLDRIRERITAIRENLERDNRIIELREQVVKESASQLENGVITATEYVTELNRANTARLSLFINRVRLAEAQAAYATTLGVPFQQNQ